MYCGALLCTAARLAWDPSTYAWFRWLCVQQYRVSAGAALAAGAGLAALVLLALAAVLGRAPRLHLAYMCGVLLLALAQVAYAVWMGTSLAEWWRDSPRAALARSGIDLLHDLKPALLAVDRYRAVAHALLDVIEEMEREAPNNVIVIVVFAFFSAILQVSAFVLSLRLSRSGRAGPSGEKEAERGEPDSEEEGEGEDASRDHQWKKKANLRMYTILDKIF